MITPWTPAESRRQPVANFRSLAIRIFWAIERESIRYIAQHEEVASIELKRSAIFITAGVAPLRFGDDFSMITTMSSFP